jgi:predicted kinase
LQSETHSERPSEGSSQPAPRPGAAQARTHWIADRLDVRLAQGRVGREQVAGLVDGLRALHAIPARAVTAAVTLAARGAAARTRVTELAPGLADRAAQGEVALGAALRAAGAALDERAAAPGTRCLHGGLRCEAIHVDPAGRAQLGAPVADAGGDPCEDVAALAVSLAARGREDLARQVTGSYAEATGDFALYRVLDAHLALAALVAAQRTLTLARDRQAAQALAERLLAAPAALAAPSAPAFVIAVAGGIASGKSTLAARLAAAHAAPVVSADAARPIGSAALDAGAEDSAYQEMFRRAGEVLTSGRPVILDACFPTRALRDGLRAFAERHGARLLVVECRAEAGVVRRRLQERARRQGRTDAEWLALRGHLLARWEPIKELPRDQHLLADTAREPELCLSRIERALARPRSPHRVRRATSRGVSISA